MLDIEYRYSSKPLNNDEIRRKSTEEMDAYIQGLVTEMKLASISVKYVTAPAVNEENMVFVNGRTVKEILKGLKIKIPYPDEDTCGHNRTKKPIVSFGRPETEWDEKYIEDIPDLLMKNAIAKVYAEMDENRIM